MRDCTLAHAHGDLATNHILPNWALLRLASSAGAPAPGPCCTRPCRVSIVGQHVARSPPRFGVGGLVGLVHAGRVLRTYPRHATQQGKVCTFDACDGPAISQLRPIIFCSRQWRASVLFTEEHPAWVPDVPLTSHAFHRSKPLPSLLSGWTVAISCRLDCDHAPELICGASSGAVKSLARGQGAGGRRGHGR